MSVFTIIYNYIITTTSFKTFDNCIFAFSLLLSLLVWYFLLLINIDSLQTVLTSMYCIRLSTLVLQMMSNPQMMRQILDSPMFQQLMSNPDIMRQMMMSNPQMRELMEVRHSNAPFSRRYFARNRSYAYR